MNATAGEIVMVVDDAPDTLTMMNDALEAAGYTVLVALEGRQALTIAKRITPAVILLDAMMPHLDGFETCRQLKAAGLTDTPVIFMTGLSDTDSVVRGLEAGGVDFLTKPIDPDEVLARIRVHLATARRTSSAHSALDLTGQTLFTVNGDGQLLWATPGVRQLFSAAGADEAWLSETMAPQLAAWLPGARPPQALSLTDVPRGGLDVQLLDAGNPAERLLKLTDANLPSGPELLRARLPLTPREAEVSYWMAAGKSNREIAERLEMSPRTVNKHLEQVFRKLEVDNRTAAAAVCIKLLD